MIYEKWLLESLFHLLFFGFGICIDIDNEVIEDDDDINLESFGNELDDNDNWWCWKITSEPHSLCMLKTIPAQ